MSWAEWAKSSCCMSGLHRTIWYELQARDWPFKNQAAEALIWQIGSGEGMKRVLASVSLGKEVTVSSHLFVRGEGRRARGQGVGTGQGCTLFPFLFLWGPISSIPSVTQRPSTVLLASHLDHFFSWVVLGFSCSF